MHELMLEQLERAIARPALVDDDQVVAVGRRARLVNEGAGGGEFLHHAHAVDQPRRIELFQIGLLVLPERLATEVIEIVVVAHVTKENALIIPA